MSSRTGVAFRPAVPDDAEAVDNYHYRCWQQAFAQLMEPGVVAAMDPSEFTGR